MYRTLITTISGLVLSVSGLYVVLTSSVSQNPSLAKVLPVVLGFVAMFSYVLIRTLFIKGDINSKSTLVLYRQGLLLALVVIIIVALQDFRVLSILDAILITSAAILFELFFQSEKSDYIAKE